MPVSNRPWQVSTLVLLVLTLLMWSEMKVNITFGALEASKSNLPSRQALVEAVRDISSRIAQNSSSSAVPTRPVSSGVDPAIDAKRVDNKLAVNVFPAIDKTKDPTTNLVSILESADAKQAQDQVIPKEGTKSSYGLIFGLESFTDQKGWSKSVALDPKWKDLYEQISTSVYHPCCGVTISTNDCGHAIAMTGLIKKMLTDGKSESEIRLEILSWQKYYFPKHYVIMALAAKKAGMDLAKIDLSANYSTVQSEKYASDFLIY